MGPPMSSISQYHHHPSPMGNEAYQLNGYDFIGPSSGHHHQNSFPSSSSIGFQHGSFGGGQSQNFNSTPMHGFQSNQGEHNSKSFFFSSNF